MKLVRTDCLWNQCIRSELAGWWKSHEIFAAAALWTTFIPLLENSTFEEVLTRPQDFVKSGVLRFHG